MAESVLFVDLGIGATNEQILDQMSVMKKARQQRLYKHIVCTIRGFDDDPRELFDIVEVRAFCRRIVNLGFISYLDFSTIFDDRTPLMARKSWGAAEVWLCSEGRLRMNSPLTRYRFWYALAMEDLPPLMDPDIDRVPESGRLPGPSLFSVFLGLAAPSLLGAHPERW